MISQTEINQMRDKAIALLVKKQQEPGYLIIDYAIDDEVRREFKMPNRPVGSPPYVGWMSSPKKTESPKERISQTGIDLIKRWEGCRTNSYLCPAGVWTVGYGHTKTAKPNQIISHLEAEELLQSDLRWFEEAVGKYVTVPINQNQFDALVSFTFNVGIGAFKNSTLLRLLNQKKYLAAANEFHRWTNANGRKLPGLINRRKQEYALFTK